MLNCGVIVPASLGLSQLPVTKLLKTKQFKTKVVSSSNKRRQLFKIGTIRIYLLKRTIIDCDVNKIKLGWTNC